MVFRKLFLKSSVLVLILFSGMVFLAGCGAKDNSLSSQPEKTIEDTKQAVKDQEPAKETASEPANEPAQNNQSTTANSSASMPQIPHVADANTDCLSCHKEGINGAPKTPHPERQGCFSCHSSK